MNFRFLFVLSVCLAALPSPVKAGWGSGGCANGSCSAPAAVAAYAPVYASEPDGWQHRNDEPHIWGLFVGGAQVAGYNAKTGAFHTYSQGAFRAAPLPMMIGKRANANPCPDNCPCDKCDECECGKGTPCGDGRCPCLVSKVAGAERAKVVFDIQLLDAQYVAGDISNSEYIKQLDPLWIKLTGKPHGPIRPLPEQVGADTVPNFGVDRSKISVQERSSINGRAVTKQQVLDAIGDPQKGIPDDANLLRLTIVADDAASLAKLKALLTPAIAPFADKLVIQWYTKDNWAIRAEYGFEFTKLPELMLQEPEKVGKRGGKPLFQEHIGNNPAPLIAAVRQKVDGYDPKKVPGLAGDPANIPPAAVLGALALFAAGFIVFKK